jgi:hypothetical protein
MHGHVVHLLYKLLVLLLLFPVQKYNYTSSCLKVGHVASIVATNHDAIYVAIGSVYKLAIEQAS